MDPPTGAGLSQIGKAHREGSSRSAGHRRHQPRQSDLLHRRIRRQASDYHDQFTWAIDPYGTIGRDRVPDPVQIGLEPGLGPPGANGRRSEDVGSESGGYRFSDTPTFTLDVDIRPEGDRLVNGDARCAEGYQGSLSCHTGEHGFAFESIGGEDWSSP